MIEGYIYDHPPEVRAYLVAHPQLYLALEKARPKLKETFGEEKVHLDVIYDPEGGAVELFATIKTPRHWRDARKDMSNFDEWWEGSEFYEPHVTFSLDFIGDRKKVRDEAT